MASSAMYNANDYIYIICRKSTYLKELKISGPIVSPIRVKMSTAYAIVLRGVELYQYEKKYQEYAKMTIKNCMRKDKFKGYVAEQAAKSAPAPTPVTNTTQTSVQATNTASNDTSTSTKNSGKNKNNNQQKSTNTSNDNAGASITVNNEATAPTEK